MISYLLSKFFSHVSRPAVDNDAAGIRAPVVLPVFSEAKIDELGKVVELVLQDIPERDVVEEVVPETWDFELFEARTKFQGGEDVLGHVRRSRRGQSYPSNVLGYAAQLTFERRDNTLLFYLSLK